MELIPGLPYDIGVECLVRVPFQYFSSLTSVCQSWKNQMELPAFWRHRKAAGMTQRVIVMTQAQVDRNQKHKSIKNSAMPIYRHVLLEPETGCWSELPPIPGHLDGLPMFCQLVGVKLNLVMIGGWNPLTWKVSNAVYVYDFASAKWSRGTDMPGCQRSFFACASDYNGMVFVAGGHDDDKNALRSALAYDMEKDKWVRLPDMARGRDECKGVLHGGKFLVIGGYDTNMQGRFETSAEAFDVENWQWDAVQDDFLARPMCPRTCVDAGDGRLYFCRNNEVVAVESSRWHIVAELPIELRITSYVTAWQGKLLVIGSSGFNQPQRCCILDLRSRKWTKVRATKGFTGLIQSGCSLEV